MAFPERLRTAHTIETEDGWELVMFQDRPRHCRSTVPVFLLHGLASTTECWYGGRSGGIATALAEAGREVWTLQMRGGPFSKHPDRFETVRMSDKLRHDVPTAIRYILEQSGQDTLDAVGHSMGGILLSLYALSSTAAPIRRLVTIGSPLTLDRAVLPRFIRNRFGRAIAQQLRHVPLQFLSERFSWLIPARLVPTHFCPQLADRPTTRQVLQKQVSDLFGSEMAELVDWISRSDARVLLSDGLKLSHRRMPVPTRFIVGARDSLTSPEAVSRTFHRIGASDSDLHILGTEQGYRHDYRHFDVLVGGKEASEATGLVLDWLCGPVISQVAGQR
jgi:pimeloyl-ACP methyl ester carboxylesterase